jgi:heme-degrading monooxygenase HmoA
VALFAPDPAYRDTRLVRDTKEPRRYLTFDSWASEAAYNAFRQKHATEYLVLDRECEKLTESEEEIGCFETVPQ